MSYIQTIGWHNELIPPSLQIFTKGCIFIFNVGENSQRFRLCNKLGLGKIRYIFLTSLNTFTFCGLPSLILSLDGCNVEHVTIFGPPGTREILCALLETILELKIKTTLHDVENYSELVKSHGITIYGIPSMESQDGKNLAYLAKWDDIPGTFNPDLATKFGVPKGPEFGKLKKGHTVHLPNGQVVHSSQVCGQGLEGESVLITDCNAEQVPFYLGRAGVCIENIYYIFYLGDPCDIPKGSKNIVCNQTNGSTSYIPLYPPACKNYAYNKAFPQIFPKPIECRGFYPVKNSKGQQYPPLTKFYIHPINSTIDTSEALRDTFEDDISNYSDLQELQINDWSIEDDACKFTFLGTGCSYPSVYRNVSAILLEMKDDSFLFDAGEGTVLQLLRSSSSHKDFVSRLTSIRTIFISHSHADHHLGLYNLLALQEQYRRDAMDDSVTTIIAPERVHIFLTQYKRHIMDINYNFVYTSESTISINGFLITMFKVVHIEDSLGIKVSHPELGQMVYSGDTRPCENLIRHTHDVDVLIHEATFTECDLENAVKSNHSTFKEALDIAKMCNVKTLVLTHFSQRYQELAGLCCNAILAQDLMSISLKHNSFKTYILGII